MNLRQKDALGGYGGVMARLPWGLYAHVEGQYKGGAGVAASLTWVFSTVRGVE